MPSQISTIVIGAGISGLICAYALRKAGLDVVVLEASERAGGVVRSIERDGFLFEQGPQSFSSTPALNALIRELGIEDHLVQAPPRSPRYVLVNGALQSVPLSPPALLTSSLLSIATKFALLRDALGRSRSPEADESVAAFVRRKFTPELLDHLVGPFVSGVYAGDPEALSLRAAFPQIHEAERSGGSLLRGLRHAAKARTEPRPRSTLFSFRDGNATLIRALAERLGSSLHCGAPVREISRTTNGKFRVSAQGSSGALESEAGQLIVATPALVASDLLKTVLPAACENLSAIPYAPTAIVSLGYRKSDVGHPLRGFGFLIPRSAGPHTLGTVWNSSLFSGRAPESHVLLTSFLGGATDPATAQLPAEHLSALTHRELSPLLGLRQPPVISNVTKYLQAVPQYNLGHSARIGALEAAQAGTNIWLTGSYLHGPSIGSCLDCSLSVAEAVRISYNT